MKTSPDFFALISAAAEKNVALAAAGAATTMAMGSSITIHSIKTTKTIKD